MSKKYKKVTDMEVLKKYCEIQDKLYSKGIWADYFSIEFLADELKTSRYQIQKAYKSLKEKGYINLKKVVTDTADYDNGEYVENIPVLFTKCYIPTDKGRSVVGNE